MAAAGPSSSPAAVASAGGVDELERLRQTLGYLASDELDGRGVGESGLDLAATFIAQRFREAGVQPPPGLADYFQRFNMTLHAEPSRSCSLALDGEESALETDYRPLSFSAEGEFAGPVHFAGYGITSAEHGYDDYAGADVDGKIVLAMRFEPHTPQGRSRFAGERYSDHAVLTQKARNAASHGATALLLVNPPQYHGPDILMPMARRYAAPDATIPIVQITQRAADAVLRRAGSAPLAQLQSQIDETGQPVPGVLPAARAQGLVRLDRQSQALRNVVGIVPGHGPLADEWVVVGAHYDHLGRVGPALGPPSDDPILNGADDNASGTTALLALAERLSAGPPPDRSIILAAFTAEEIGLVGSNRFVADPPVPLKQIVAMLNLDMVGRLRRDMLHVDGAGTGTGLDAILDEADRASPLTFQPIGRSGITPSDHMSFARVGIPVVFLHTGVHSDYHRASDEADRINYQGLALVIDAAEQITRSLAAMPRPAYVQGGGFAPPPATGSPPSVQVTIGIIPTASSFDSDQGVRIERVVPGSAAADAGLAEGDMIVAFDAQRVANLHDLLVAMQERKPGESVSLRLLRSGAATERTVTLQAKNED